MDSMKTPIPGERGFEAPCEIDTLRLAGLRPFVRQTGDDVRLPWLLRKRRLLDYLMVYIASGTGRFEVGNSVFCVGPGDLVWIPPDTLHEMEGYAPTMHCIFTHFDLLYDPKRSHWDACIPGGVTDLGPWKSLMHPSIDDPVIGSWCGKLTFGTTAEIGSQLAAMYVEHRRAPVTSSIKLSSMLFAIIGDLLWSNVQINRAVLPQRDEIRESVAFILEHSDTDLDIGRMSSHAGLSESHLRKLFRERTGQSARTMHRVARIRKACQMLAYQTGLNVSQIAQKLGFSTVHNFSRSFRQVTGCTPLEYRSGRERK